MRPAGRQRSVIVTTTPYRTLSDSLSRRDESELAPAPSDDAAANELIETEVAGVAETEVILAPAAFAEAHAAAAARERTERRRGLADEILRRIRKRLTDRVRNLVVRLDGNKVVLEGHCATYYTKQIAQQAALAMLEDEQLDNAIVVTM